MMVMVMMMAVFGLEVVLVAFRRHGVTMIDPSLFGHFGGEPHTEFRAWHFSFGFAEHIFDLDRGCVGI